MTIRLTREERRLIEEVAGLWGVRATEILRLSFKMLLLGEKAELTDSAGNRLNQE
jgi:hypothetical protein